MKKRVITDYVQDIAIAIDDIEEFTSGHTFDSFCNDRKTVSATIRSLEIIGGAAKNIPQQYRDIYPNVPWSKMSAMRDKLIHAYFGVSLKLVWNAAISEIPALKLEIDKILIELKQLEE